MPDNCSYVGDVISLPEYAKNNLRNRVGEKGGTHVAMTNASQPMRQQLLVEIPVGDNSLTISAVGYTCP